MTLMQTLQIGMETMKMNNSTAKINLAICRLTILMGTFVQGSAFVLRMNITEIRLYHQTQNQFIEFKKLIIHGN